MNVPVQDRFTDEQKEQIRSMFENGMTGKDIAGHFKEQPRTIGKLLKHIGLSRSVKETAELKMCSKLDNQDTVEKIKELRNTKSLEEIAKIFNSSISAVHRICHKHNIIVDTIQYKSLQSERMVAVWTDEKKILASSAALSLVTPELRERLRESSKNLWKNGKYRQIQSDRRAEQSYKISSIQNILYELLNDLGVKYFREYDDKPNDPETVVGFYNFDCAIPRKNDTLLIECHGDYWHSLEKTITKDNQKRSYIVNNFSGVYELKSIWEHEFKCRDKILENLKYWLGISQIEIVDFKFSDVSILPIKVKIANVLLDKYHYLSGCGRGGIVYGAFHCGKLIAVCVFSSLVRQNLPFDMNKSKELSRFCIDPRYQKKNFGSWLISRCIKLLPPQFSTIVSYCDSTFNHDGALYKACNFIEDGKVRPDYWYVSSDGWVMYKKKLYDHACKMSLKENEFAEQYGYKRVYGGEKTRFIFKR